MNKEFENIFNKAEQIKLSTAEKEEMRAHLELFVERHPVRNRGFWRHILQKRSELITNILKPMAIALIIALIVSGSAAVAAENSLPGDILYPVKINVSEKVVNLAVAFSEEAQARWEARKAERRVEEAEKLAAEGRLTADILGDLTARFEDFSEAFEERANRIEAKQGAEGAFELHSNFESSLNAHEDVLARLADRQTNVQAEMNVFLGGVRARLEAEADARADAESEITASANAELKAAAEGKLQAAENKIAEVRSFLDRMKSSVSAEVFAKAEAKLNTAAKAVNDGKAEMTAEAYGKAFASFQAAISLATEAQVLVATEDRIQLEINSPGSINTEVRNENSLDVEIR